MTELSLNARLAIAFDDHPRYPEEINQDIYFQLTPDYENDNLAAFALLEKAKKDGKIYAYEIFSRGGSSIGKTSEVRLFMDFDKDLSARTYKSYGATLSKAITQALAQLLTEDK
ncbi:MAG: hypothetical protein PHE50_00085 [Dehalococcoidales bacterium]|nr:hypothetical protein [Dehalococcoidales bacterium]